MSFYSTKNKVQWQIRTNEHMEKLENLANQKQILKWWDQTELSKFSLEWVQTGTLPHKEVITVQLTLHQKVFSFSLIKSHYVCALSSDSH